jgi:hypothetical protein
MAEEEFPYLESTSKRKKRNPHSRADRVVDKHRHPSEYGASELEEESNDCAR